MKLSCLKELLTCLLLVLSPNFASADVTVSSSPVPLKQWAINADQNNSLLSQIGLAQSMIGGSALTQIQAVAGVVNGGGGRAVVCRDANGAITSAELLDLYEAEKEYKLKIRTSTDPLESVVDSMHDELERLLKNSWQGVINPDGIPGTPEFRATLAKMNFQTGIQMPLVNDSFDVMAPIGCHPEQLAIYQLDNLILVNADIWNKLNTINQAALVFHESIYRDLRLNGATDSRDARKIVGYLFSVSALAPVVDGMKALPIIRCNSGDGQTKFVVSQESGSTGSSSLILQFEQIDNVPMITKSTAAFPVSLNDQYPQFGDNVISIIRSGKAIAGQPNEEVTGAQFNSIMSDGREAVLRWKVSERPDGSGSWTQLHFALEHQGQYRSDFLSGKTDSMKEVFCSIYSNQ